MYHVIDRIPGDSSLSSVLHSGWRGIRHMHWHTALASTSIGSGILGFVADVASAPPPVTWTFVAISGISAVCLLIRAVYSYCMRRLDHQERMALIAKGITPPPLPPFGSPKSPPPVPKEPTADPQ